MVFELTTFWTQFRYPTTEPQSRCFILASAYPWFQPVNRKLTGSCLFSGATGMMGEKGPPGAQGIQGFPGPPGMPGV